MAGSHTLMPGILYTTNTVLNVTNTNSGITSNQQTIAFPITHSAVNGGLNINGHTNMLSAGSILRPANKIIIQGTTHPNSSIVNINNTTIPCIPFSLTSSNNQIGSNGVIERNAGHNFNDPNGGGSTFKHNSVEVIGGASGNDVEKTVVKEEEEEDEEEPVIDIMINNVVCSFSVGCHLDLRNIALMGKNVEFRKENGMVTLKLRRPLTTASIWSSGKITCTGSTSEDQARIAARRVARSLQKLGYNVRFRNYRIVNVLGTCTMPFAIKISHFSQQHRRAASYEPELHPGVTYRIEQPKATLKIFSTGSITVTAPSVGNVQSAIETIYPLVKEFSKQRSPEELNEVRKLQMRRTMKEDPECLEESEESDEDV